MEHETALGAGVVMIAVGEFATHALRNSGLGIYGVPYSQSDAVVKHA